jgi:hypothetical protein
LPSVAPPVCPFPARLSPFASRAETEVRAFLRQYGLLRDQATVDYYESSRLGYLTAYIYPDSLPDRLMTISAWYGTWTMFDDQLEKLADEVPADAVAVVAQAMLSWLADDRPEPTHAVPFADAFAYAWTRIRQHCSRAWQSRFLAHTREYLDGCSWEATNRRTATVPDLDTYVHLRRRFGGIRMAMDLSEFAGGYELPPPVHRCTLVQELLDVLGDITLWGNDLYSVGVDHEEGNVSNVVFVLRHHHGCDLEKAAEITSEMIDARIRRLGDIEAELTSWCGDQQLPTSQQRDVGRFVEGARTWISGNVTWSLNNARYRTAKPRVTGSQPNFLLALLPDRSPAG